MKHLKHLLFTLPMLLIAMSFAGCNTEEVDPVIPELEIAEELTGEALESLTLQFDATESSKTFAVRCNRAWTAVSSNADWCVINPDEGDGDNTLTVTVSRNTGTSRKAEIIVSTILFKRSIYVEQKGEVADAKVIFFDNLDGEAASQDSNNKWPYANEFQKYNKKGSGAAEVTYDSYSVTVRSNSPSNDTKYNNSEYSINEASGVNNLYFAASGTFTVNKIALDGEQKLHLEWGVERNEYGNYDAPFNPDEFIVSLSADGQKWSQLTYTRSDYSAWDKASADFQLKDADEYLYVKMDASVATRVDDIKLTTGVGGQEIDLAAGSGEQEPDDPTTDGTKLYYESFDGVALTANTNLDAFEAAGGFVRQGLGGASASYAGTTFNFRKTGASTGYAGASGGNNAFGNNVDVVFVVNNINVGTAQNIDLSMGLNTYGTYTASEFEAYYTTDGGATYQPLTLTRPADKAWQLTTASFTVAEAENIVGLKFVSKVKEQQFRIDDLTLTTKDEGVKVVSIPIVKTAEAADITMSGATLGGSYEFDGTISEVGVAYKAEGATDYTVEKAIAIQSPFSVTLNTLTDGTNYEYYAYVVADGKEYKGDVKTFTTDKDSSVAVTYFADDFATVENNKVYTSGKWNFTSTDAGWPANAYLGWFGKTYDKDGSKYINIAPYSSSMTEVVAYAVMTKFNVAEAEGKKLTFDLAWFFQEKDNSKFEVVASKNYTGDVAVATWEVVESYTYTDESINPKNTWTSYSLDLSTKYAEEKALAVAFRYTGKSNTYRLDNVEFGAVEAPVDVLTVVTGEATNVTATTATVAGSYSGVTEAPAEVGIEYRMSGVADYTKVAAAAVAESFTVELSNLVEESTYEYRAYAVAGEATTYGEVKTFTTAAPATITPIADVEFGNTYTMEGQVTAVSTNGFVFTDATGSIFFYGAKNYAVGQNLTITGEISSYDKYCMLQIKGSTATIVEGEAGTYTYPTPSYADATAVDAYVADTNNRKATYVAMAGTMSISGNYYNIVVDGTTNQGSFYYASDDTKALVASGDKVVVYGYAVAANNSKYYNIVVTDVVKITDIANVELDGEYTMMGQVTALTSNGFVLTDATGSIFSYGKKSYKIGQELVATGAIGAYNKGFQLTSNKTTFLEGAVKAYTYPKAATADAAAIDAFIANTDNRLATYVTLTGDLAISGNYYNMTIDGTTNMGSIYYPNDDIKAALSTGTNITVKGYAMAVSGGKYYNVIATEAVTNYVIPKITAAATSMSFVAEGEAKTNELTVAGQGELSLFAKSSDEHFTAAIEGTTLTVTAAANTTTEAKSATVTVYMAESADAEAVASVEIACSQAAPSSGEGDGEGDGEGETTTKSYVKVTSAADLTDGKYLIVSESSNVALKDAIDAVSNTIAVTIADGKIASDAATDAAAFTLTVSNGALKGPNGKYMGQTSDANGMKFSASAYTHTITFETSGDANIQSQGKAYLRYNAASDQLRFRYYKSSTYTKQKAIQLYKLVE